jgi:hypothetical protein
MVSGHIVIVSVTPFEIRIASLEGSYQQVSARLTTIDQRLGDLERNRATDFRWTIATIFGSWATLLGAILVHH